jgi:hypothetical protein
MVGKKIFSLYLVKVKGKDHLERLGDVGFEVFIKINLKSRF